MAFQPGTAAPPTAAQMALYGHIAARLRAFLAEKSWSVGDLNQAMGIKRANTAIYGYVNCRGAPGPKVAAKLAKLMGCPESELRARDGKAPPPGQEVTVLPPTPKVAAAPRPFDILTFAVQSDGNARLRLDSVMPFDRATPLLRLLLDAGLVIGKGEGAHDQSDD